MIRSGTQPGKVSINEGLDGTVIFTEGNCMPPVDESSCRRYSLFIEEQGSLYANLWNNDGYLQAATVTEGEAVFITLDITHSAYF